MTNMSDEIIVYNLDDNGVTTESVASQPEASIGAPVVSDPTSSQSNTTTNPITEGDVRILIKQELSHFSGDIRIGSLLSGQVFIVDGNGLRMGSTSWEDAPFRVDYDGNLVATSATITIASLGGFDIGADYIRDTANSFGLSSNVSVSDDVRFWAGSAFSARATAPARIYESGAAFFSDVTIAGTIRSTVFGKDVVSAVGGQLIVANADVLDLPMTAQDSSTLTIKGETTFAVNNILHIKDGTDEEYLRVTSIASAPTYSVTRDLAGAYASNSNPAWAAGNAVVVEGSSDGASTYSGGYLRLLGAGTNSPRYSVFARTGLAYNNVTEYIGLGNLNGLLDYVSEIYGISIGTSALGFLSFDSVNGLRTSGKVVSQQTFTAGNYIPIGSVIAVESDGKAYRSRWKDFSTQNATTSLGTGGTNTYLDKNRIFSISSTLKAHFESIDPGGTGTANLRVRQITVSPTSSAITSVSNTTISSAGRANWIDAIMLTSNAAIAVWEDSSTTTIRASYVSSLDGTPSVGAAATFSTSVSGGGHICIVKVSSTEALLFYRDTSNDIKAIPITVSGTTCTFGSSQSVASHASDQYMPCFATTFQGTSSHCLYFADVTNNISYVVGVLYSGGTVTAGTPVQYNSSLGINTPGAHMCNVDATTMMVAERFSPGGSNSSVEINTVTLSGSTTLVVNTAVSIETGIASTTQHQCSIEKVGTYSYILGYWDSTTSHVLRLIDLSTSTPTLIGGESAFAGVGVSGETPIALYHSPGRIVLVNNTLVRTVDMANNFTGTVGVSSTSALTDASVIGILNGENTNETGLTTGVEYYADVDGGLISASSGGTKRIGVAHGTTKIIVQV